MSSDHGHGAAHAHHHDDHAFDPEPVHDLSAEETPSPGWLPVVGGALFLVAAVWFFYPGGEGKRAAPPPPPAATAAAAPAAKPPAATGSTRLRPAAEGRRRPSLDLKALPGKRTAPSAAPRP